MRDLRTMITAAMAISYLSAGPAVRAENLLLNSSFNLATNHAIPDYWGLHHAAALQFRDLYSQYGLVDTPRGPVSGARVLKITNSDTGFPYLYLLSRVPQTKLPSGQYVFSVYVMADRPGNAIDLAPSLEHLDQRNSARVTTEWHRYSAEFHFDDHDGAPLSPMLAFPNRGTYWISSPQLELGSSLTSYAPAPEDSDLGRQNAAQRSAAAAALSDIAVATSSAPVEAPSARFEYSVYTDEPTARLRLAYGGVPAFGGTMACNSAAASEDKSPFFSSRVAPAGGRTQEVDIPVAGLAPGEYTCSIRGPGRFVSAKLTKLPPKSLIVRSNQFRNTLEINKSPFHIRGVMVGDVIPPEWYFADVVDHGINTLFYYPRLRADGAFNTLELDAMLRRAHKYGMKVIINPAVAGQYNGAWKPQLARYGDLVRRYANSDSIIGWFAVDEPQEWSLQKHDLADIYTMIKTIDPYRLVFINWGSDDVPAGVGVEPHGSLAATDLYSIDYYPFANSRTSMEIYALRTIRALRTAELAGRPGHSWLQLYGYLDVTREPTADELNFMAYVDVLYGGNYSFWQEKSNAKSTWDQVRTTNHEIDVLTKLLWLNPQASELEAPTLSGRYLYSAWEAQGDHYLIVVHVSGQSETFALDLKPIFGSRVTRAGSYFGETSDRLAGTTLEDSFDAYGTRVYKIDLARR
jgi:hypothetical protein